MFREPHLAPRPANIGPLTPLSFLERALEVHITCPAVARRGQTWNYVEFGELVARMAAWLRKQGVGQGDVVSLILTNRPNSWPRILPCPPLGRAQLDQHTAG